MVVCTMFSAWGGVNILVAGWVVHKQKAKCGVEKCGQGGLTIIKMFEHVWKICCMSSHAHL